MKTPFGFSQSRDWTEEKKEERIRSLTLSFIVFGTVAAILTFLSLITYCRLGNWVAAIFEISKLEALALAFKYARERDPLPSWRAMANAVILFAISVFGDIALWYSTHGHHLRHIR